MPSKQLLSVADLELRRLTKQANQRLRRLEAIVKKEGGSTNQAYQTAQFMLEGKRRFAESEAAIAKLTADQKAEQMYAVSAFLNNPLSQAKAERKRRVLKKELDEELRRMVKEGKPVREAKRLIKKREQEMLAEAKAEGKKRMSKAKEEGLKRVINYESIEQQAILTSLSDEAKPQFNKAKEKQFWRVFNKAKAIFKNKTFDYRTLAKAITWRLQAAKGTTRQIVKAMQDVVRKENLDRRMLFEAIGRA